MSPEEEKVAESTEETTGAEEKATGAAAGETEDVSETPEEVAEREAREKDRGEEEDKEPEKHKRPGGFQRRIRKLNARIDAANAEAVYWREQASARQKQEEKPTTVVDGKAKPRPEDFAIKEEDGGGYDQAAFTEALTDWKLGQGLAERDAKTQKNEAQTAEQKQNGEFMERETTFAETHSDYEEVTSDAQDVLEEMQHGGSSSIGMIGKVLALHEQGPDLLYYLGQNPDEIRRIAKQSQHGAVMSLGAIAASLAQSTAGEEKEPPTPVVSGAPKPPAPIKKAAGGRRLKPDDPATSDQMSDREWLKARRAQLRSSA